MGLALVGLAVSTLGLGMLFFGREAIQSWHHRNDAIYTKWPRTSPLEIPPQHHGCGSVQRELEYPEEM